MKERDTTIDQRVEVDNPRHLRLTTLLRDLVRREGRMEAAEMLGINYKTLARAIESGNLTPRLSDALERRVLEDEESTAARQQQRIEALEQGVKALEGRMEALGEELRSGFKALRSAIEMKDEVPRNDDAGEAVPASAPRAVEEERLADRDKEGAAPRIPGLRPLKWAPHRRLDPLVVPEEPEPDDEEVYGPAWPVIGEWRSLRKEHPNQGKSLSWLVTEERILGLELAMLEEHGLTLPPEEQPLRGFGRNGQINWRRTALNDTRRALARRDLLRWVRRALTLGLWWR